MFDGVREQAAIPAVDALTQSPVNGRQLSAPPLLVGLLGARPLRHGAPPLPPVHAEQHAVPQLQQLVLQVVQLLRRVGQLPAAGGLFETADFRTASLKTLMVLSCLSDQKWYLNGRHTGTHWYAHAHCVT